MDAKHWVTAVVATTTLPILHDFAVEYRGEFPVVGALVTIALLLPATLHVPRQTNHAYNLTSQLLWALFLHAHRALLNSSAAVRDRPWLHRLLYAALLATVAAGPFATLRVLGLVSVPLAMDVLHTPWAWSECVDGCLGRFQRATDAVARTDAGALQTVAAGFAAEVCRFAGRACGRLWGVTGWPVARALAVAVKIVVALVALFAEAGA